MVKVVVYTVLIGDKEALNDPLQHLADRGTDLELDFVCFTDNTALTSPTWSFRSMPTRMIPPEKLSRLPKALPHRFFEEDEYSLYIDNTVVFKRMPCRADLAAGEGAVFRAFRHPWRTCPQDEADVVVRSGLDEAEIVAAQTRFYDRRNSLSSLTVLTAGTTLLRRHHDPRVKEFGELWWEQILLFSARDQISLDQCAREADCPINHFPGDKTNSDLIVWPALSTPRRVEATFDAERYAWEKRHDPIARERPKAHYLLNGGVEKYERHPAWFRYCCSRAGSGFGRQAPRRWLADIVDPLLREMTGNPGSILIVGVASPRLDAVDPSELTGAEDAIKYYFRFNPGNVVLSAVVPEEAMAEPAPFRGAHGMSGYRLVVAIGLSPADHASALAKFFPLLDAQGTLVVQFGAPLSVAEMQRMQDAVGEPCSVTVYHGGHVTRPDPIPSSVFLARRAQDA